MKIIGGASFRGPFDFCSNFFPHPIKYGSLIYKCSEYAFQAAKNKSLVYRKMIQKCKTPADAKMLGNLVELRPDWEEVKYDIMEEINRIKFSDPVLKKRLTETGHLKLIEYNYWHDLEWGVDSKTKKGENHLGIILMKIRKDLRK